MSSAPAMAHVGTVTVAASKQESGRGQVALDRLARGRWRLFGLATGVGLRLAGAKTSAVTLSNASRELAEDKSTDRTRRAYPLSKQATSTARSILRALISPTVSLAGCLMLATGSR